MSNRGKLWQIADVIRSKIVVEIGVFYYRLPWVTLGDLECRGETVLGGELGYTYLYSAIVGFIYQLLLHFHRNKHSVL